MADIHSESFVKGLFDEMAQIYGLVNLFSSLGFAWLWRRQAVHALAADSRRICDLMTGGAECLEHIKKHHGNDCEVDLVDWSAGMCQRAEATVERGENGRCRVLEASALEMPVEDCFYDAVVSNFGLKALTPNEVQQLAKEVKRILKPGGSLSMLEFSMPASGFIRFFFRLYVKFYVPFLGWVFLGNPDNYRMLWRYTREFGDCRQAYDAFVKEGFVLEYRTHFFGSATQIVGCTKQA